MKRIIFILLVIIFAFCGCSGSILETSNDTTLDLYGNSIYNSSTSSSSSDEEIILSADNYIQPLEQETFTASWLTYLELFPADSKNDETAYKQYIKDLMDKLVELSIDNLFVQVRPFADAIYYSDYFPSTYLVSGTQADELPFDYLQAIIEVASEYDIAIHAWINPYRVLSNSNDVDELSEDNIAYQWIQEDNGNVFVLDSSIYFNPASSEVQQLVLNGVRELLENYDIAGIHLDDYFYPSTDESIDQLQYETYTESGGSLSLAEYRRENVNNLMSALYTTVKSYSSDIILSVSPSGDIEKNYSEHYCDVRLWLSTAGYADMVIPQIYYGFLNETFAFESCLNDWIALNTNTNIDLCIGLALYKVGKEDVYAGDTGSSEWIDNDDILSRQVSLLLSSNCTGFSLYSITSIDFTDENVKNELLNLQNLLN